MANKIIQAKDFKSRQQLENEIRNKFSLTVDEKPTVTIQGTDDELAGLQLGHNSKLWGIVCVSTDYKAPEAPTEEVDRGPQTSFGINERPGESKEIINNS